jgi:hypothetical protein
MQSQIALITFLGGGGGSVDNTLPGSPAYPSHGLPPGTVQLPVFPFDPTVPDQGLPPGQPGAPDQGLPPGQPGTPTHPIAGGGYPSHQPIVPGKRFIVKWLACSGLILVPDQGLPPTPEPK